MQRKTFFTIAAVVAVLFGLVMLASPGKMMEGMGSQPNDSTNAVLVVVAVFLISVGIMTFLARKDEGSIALRAIIIGSIVMHIALIPIDWVAYAQGTFTKMSGFLPGTIVHIIFAAGFIYYLARLSSVKESDHASVS